MRDNTVEGIFAIAMVVLGLSIIAIAGAGIYNMISCGG